MLTRNAAKVEHAHASVGHGTQLTSLVLPVDLEAVPPGVFSGG